MKKIAEVARLYGITGRALRHYEQIGILQSHRQPSGYREYDLAQLQRLEVILFLRRMGLGLRDIGDILSDKLDLQKALQAKIISNGKILREAKEIDSLLRDFEKELAHHHISEISIAEILGRYTYLSKKTERMNPMKNEKYLVAFGSDLVDFAEILVAQIKALRETSPDLPPIRIMDEPELAGNEYAIIWDSKEARRSKFLQKDAAAFASEVVAVIKKSFES